MKSHSTCTFAPRLLPTSLATAYLGASETTLRGLPPMQGRDRMEVRRLICAHAFERGLICSDPLVSVRRPAPPKHGGHPARTHHHAEASRARCPIGTRQRGCTELLYWMGAPIGDGVSLRLTMARRDIVLTFRQPKTGDFAHVPRSCSLPVHVAHQGLDRCMMQEAMGGISTSLMTFLSRHNSCGVRSAIVGQIREYCRKPEETYRAAEKLVPDDQRIEVFSRQRGAGWSNWGHEAEKFEEAS